MSKAKVLPKKGKCNRTAKKATPQAETIEISTKKGKPKTIPFKAPAGKISKMLYEQLTQTVKNLNGCYDYFQEQIKDLEADVRIKELEGKVRIKEMEREIERLKNKPDATSCYDNDDEMFAKLLLKNKIFCENINPFNKKKPQPRKEISIQGQSFGVFPAVHFVKLINATN